MTKYVITYGLKDDMKSKVENYNHLTDAWEDAQALALKELKESGKVPYMKDNIYNSFSDIIQAQSMYVDMASEYIDFHAKELTDESIIYIVSQQSSAFSNDKFIHISLEEALIILKEESILALDTETEGLDPFTKTLLLLQMGNKDYQINFDIASYGGVIPMQLVDFLNNHKCLFVLQNAKFDLKFLFKQDVLIRSVYDTMLAEIILTNGLQYDGRDLKTLGEKYCNVVLDKSVRGEIIAKGLSDRVIEYASNDVKYLLEIREKQLEKIKEYNLQTALDLDNAFVIVLAYTEYCGIKLDFDKWTIKALKNIDTAEGYRKELTDFLFADGKTKYFSGMVDMFTGTRECLINWDSPKQVTKLFEEYGINVTVKVKGEEKISIEARNLEPQQKDFPILIPYLKYKAAQKEVSTYGLGWKKHINPITGRIHTTYQQIMNTGRLSSGNKRDGTPNMQNIPRDAETRACFIAEKGNLLVDADYSSQEQIVLANFSKEPNLLNFYARGFKDMHSYVAFLMYKDIRRSSVEELTPENLAYLKDEYPEQRRIAKSAGFAINYGGDGSTIARNCNISRKEGAFVYDSYFEAFPELKNYFELVFARAAHYGYIEFNRVTKRKYFFDKDENPYFKYREEVNDPYFWQKSANPRGIRQMYGSAQSEIQRIAQNYPIQGSSADITKYAGIIFFREILKRNWWLTVKIVAFVHDEILVECPAELSEEVRDVLIDSMKEAGKPFCQVLPLGAEAMIGDHWVH